MFIMKFNDMFFPLKTFSFNVAQFGVDNPEVNAVLISVHTEIL